ncbi:hypothetical protein [Gemmatimonas phototrophica]|uniref:hypothetical protein n=1 Tax=Gemmatimonas phototrophica TaxID=1379270 RepID=UPI0011AE4529|nr:hypothetical protein [Gemmatimonas phototrophica]
MPASVRAQDPFCEVQVNRVTIATQTVMSGLATALEYEGTTRSAGWRMAHEPNRAVILADPSSHLHALGTYHIARAAVTPTCGDQGARRRAAWRSASVAMTVGLAKEVADGYYNGFSPTDLAVDALGAGYAVAQAYVPVLEKVTPSFSVAPRAVFRRRGPRGALMDYSQQTAWLSTNVHDLLPRSAAKVWPSPVRLSVGRRAFGGGTPSEYVLGLDLDAERLPGNHPAWMRVKKALHNLRLPGPALVYTGNKTSLIGLYW